MDPYKVELSPIPIKERGIYKNNVGKTTRNRIRSEFLENME
jgi:predicted transglutaminase-like protease